MKSQEYATSPQRPQYITSGSNKTYEDEFFENEMFILDLQKKLNSLKNDRKKADQDAGLLKNRLNLLKDEEDKVK